MQLVMFVVSVGQNSFSVPEIKKGLIHFQTCALKRYTQILANIFLKK